MTCFSAAHNVYPHLVPLLPVTHLRVTVHSAIDTAAVVSRGVQSHHFVDRASRSGQISNIHQFKQSTDSLAGRRDRRVK